MLQEAHVAVQQSVGRRQDPYRFHPGPPLGRALHRHVSEARQAKIGALAEVTVGDRGETDEDALSHKGAASWPFLPFHSLFNTLAPARGKDTGMHLKQRSLLLLGTEHFDQICGSLTASPARGP